MRKRRCRGATPLLYSHQSSELDLRSELDDPVGRDPEELRGRLRVSRHHHEDLLAPARHAQLALGWLATRAGAVAGRAREDDALATEIERRIHLLRAKI